MKHHSNNLGVLHRLVKSSNLLDDVLRFAPRQSHYNPLLMVIQLLFTHWSLDHSLECPTYSFGHSQQAVYGRPKDFPLFLNKHLRINIEYLLHIANFFKYHMTRSEEHTLFEDFSALEDDHKPAAWTEKLRGGVTQLGRHWLGSYCKMELD